MKKIKIIFLLAVLAFLASGCSISFKTKDTSSVDGGVFASLDKGATWRQAVLVPTVKGAPESIASLDSGALAFDPSDPMAIYFGSASKGLFYTYNIANGWTSATGLSEGAVNAVAVSPDNKCQIYAAIANKAYRSDDCNRSWKEIYFDNDTQAIISSLVIDNYDPQKIYLGTSRGDVIKSLDRGENWKTILRAGYRAVKISLSPQDSRIVFVSTNGNGLYRSFDGGDNWQELKKEKMAAFKNGYKIVDFFISPSEEALVFAATNYGLFKSTDYGDTWTQLELITPEDNATINAFAVSPKNAKEIYYTTNTTFYSSFDGGISWRTRKLPSTRAGWRLIIKPDETNVIFMGLKKYQPSGVFN